jgi:hypothetical protein
MDSVSEDLVRFCLRSIVRLRNCDMQGHSDQYILSRRGDHVCWMRVGGVSTSIDINRSVGVSVMCKTYNTPSEPSILLV